MHIGIGGAISTESVLEFLPNEHEKLPVGKPGAPLMATLIRALIEKGHQVSAYTHSRELWRDGSDPVVLRGLSGFKLTIVPFRPHSFRPNRATPGRMLDMFRQERRALCDAITGDMPDLIHAHWTYEFAMAALDSRLPHVITAHDSPLQVLKYTRNLYRLGRYVMARKVYGAARNLTAVSPYLKNQVQRYAHVPIHVIGNPIPYQVVDHSAVSGGREHVLSKPKIAMVLNGWSRFKNGENGLAAFSLLEKRLPGATLHCFGYDYGQGEKANAWVKSQDITARIEFHGAIPHEKLLAQLAEMDLLLHPALEESCPLTLLEAMALGVPVVGGVSSGGVPWVLDNGRAGRLADVLSARAICDAMLELLNENIYDSIRLAAKTRIDAMFTPVAVIEQYESVYADVLSKLKN